MDYHTWLRLIEKIRNKEIDSHNTIDDEDADIVLSNIALDIKKYGYYTYDGRYQDATIRILIDKFSNGDTNIKYNQIVKEISEELKKLVVTNMILIPMNHLNESFLPPILELEPSNIVLFSMKEKISSIERDNSQLANHFERHIKSKLNSQHILNTKDRNFFNYPILAIKIDHIDFRVEQEAAKISEASYSFLRMLDFGKNREPNDKGWGVFIRDKKRGAYTYVVYYEDYKSLTNKFNEGHYGYSFQFKFSPVLDINTDAILSYKEKYTTLLRQFINVSFMNEIDYNEEQIKRYDRWKNAVLLFNTAYEFASIEKYDSALLILITILESLFIKRNEGGGGKSKKLQNRVSLYLKDFEGFINIDIAKVINDTYDYRNDFVHEGKRLDRYQTYRPFNDGQAISGQKPFIYGLRRSMPEQEYHNFINLIKIVIKVLTTDITQLPNINVIIKALSNN